MEFRIIGITTLISLSGLLYWWIQKKEDIIHYNIILNGKMKNYMKKYIDDNDKNQTIKNTSFTWKDFGYYHGMVNNHYYEEYNDHYNIKTSNPEELAQDLEKYVNETPMLSHCQPRMKYIYLNGNWRQYGEVVNRSFDTLFLSEKNREQIKQIMTKFESYECKDDFVHALGIIIKGGPGTGKTSLINSLTTTTKRSPYYLNAENMTKTQFLESLMDIPVDTSIIIMERIDELTKEKNPDIYYEILNLLDGVLTRPNQIVILTTENPEELNDQLTREGRIHLDITLDNCTNEIINQIYNYYSEPILSDDDINNLVKENLAPSKLIYTLENGSELNSIIHIS